MTAEIDWKKVDELMLSGCTGVEIAGYFGIHPETLYKRVERDKNMGFSAYLQEKRSKGDSILRAHQYAKALGLTEKGDNTLLIWLGKTRLNQKEASDNVLSEQKEYLNQKFEEIISQLSGEPSLNRKIEDNNISNETKS